MDAGFFKGTSTDQDKRFSDKEAKLLKSLKFPPEYDTRVDMRKVKVEVMRPWIAKKVVELVGFEDEVVIEYAVGLLEDKDKPIPDPRLIQINLQGFLTTNTAAFMKALWSLLIEAQNNPAGIPQTFIEQQKEDLKKAQANRGPQDQRRERLDEVRERERRERNDARGDGGGGRGFRGGRGGGRGGYSSRFDDRGDRGGMDDRGGGGRGRGRDAGWGARGGGVSAFIRMETHS
ncbi:PWI domain-containing protein [Sistotremastrum niveocremeum HHB9708]|uniref:PWI domain-containing protein n=1 Tax=Sistotremastrum niveocremeum HHB9708 TaxID=1314777 RepID=A0A164XWI1_9AGAM|nr:PWI domain-containing protein [Sistotremastrum niveocremeum HHB9708]